MDYRDVELGMRVVDEFLGNGVVKGIPFKELKSLVLIQFDVRPPDDYNCGVNPCLRFASDFEPLPECPENDRRGDSGVL